VSPLPTIAGRENVMASIQTSTYPLVFPVAEASAEARLDRIQVKVLARALEGMQKEALVTTLPAGRAWRMVCDEGPYLNGTDLAPFPLAFFASGLVNAYLSEVVGLAKASGISIKRIEIIQENFYTMEGSAIRGDMIGGALPVALHIRIDSEASDREIQSLVMNALARSPGDAYLRTVLASEFSILKNGKPLTVGDVRAWDGAIETNLDDAMFDALRPGAEDYPPDIISKLAGGDTVFNVEGGAGSSLQSEQKRTLHIRSIATLRDDGLSETRVQLFKPIGSNFRFLCELERAELGGERAPSPLAYLAAGVAFCYLTQIGRYASIMKYDDLAYSVAQEMDFLPAKGEGSEGAPPAVTPVRTQVSLKTNLSDDVARKIVDMGERTCFLHAVSRTPLKSKVRITGLERDLPDAEASGAPLLR
jgi:uncharacterized OsmC-like protein